jgi:hypothetical protein
MSIGAERVEPDDYLCALPAHASAQDIDDDERRERGREREVDPGGRAPSRARDDG